MNRRDTIIIAVLLNAGVLAVLFMLAVNEKTDEQVFTQSMPPIVHAEPPKSESKAIALSSAPADDILDFNMDESLSSASEEPSLPLEQYAFSSDPEVVEPVKASQRQPAAPQQQSKDAYVEVTVKRGDSLDKLARSNGTTIEAIKANNNLKSDMLSIGQVLRIPVGSKAPVVQKPTEVKKAAPDAGSNGSFYTIKTGDSPWKIAKQNNMNLDDLLRLNNLDEEKARNLKVGDKIRIK